MRESVRALLLMNYEKEARGIIKTLEQADSIIEHNAAFNLADFCGLLKKNKWDIIIFDYRVNCASPDRIFSEIRKAGLSVPVIAIIEDDDVPKVFQLTKNGCYNYVIKGDYNRLLKITQYELKAAKEKLIGNYPCGDWHAIMSSIADGVISTDKKGRIVFINGAAQNLTGWDEYTAIRQPLDTVLNIINAKTREKIRCRLTQPSHTGEKDNPGDFPILITKTGSERHISLQIIPMKDEDGQVTGRVITFQDITYYRRIDEQLRIERNNLRTQFQYAPVGMAVVDNRLVIRSANDCFVDMCASPDKGIIGKDLCKSLGCADSLDNKGKNCSKCLMRECIMRVIESEIPLRDVEKKYSLIRNNRTVIGSFRCYLVPINIEGRICVLISIEDMTEQRTMEEKLRKSRDFYLTLFQEFPAMIWRTDCSKGINYVNKKWLEFTGRKIQQELGTGWMDNIHPEDIKAYVEKYNEAFDKKESFRYEYRIKRSDGEYRWFAAYASPYYDLNKDFAGYIGTSYDITEKKQLESEMQRAMEATNAAYRAKSEFLANMSHEIRTPLNGILGMIDLTIRTALTEEQRDNLVTVKACANSLLSIINDVLDFSKMEAGKYSIENVEFDFKSLMDKIIKVHYFRAKEKGIELNHQIPTDLPDFLIGDPNRLQQILNNLFSNAIKFTDRGFVSLVIKVVERNETNVRLQFSVVDTGIGISDDEMEKLFKSFSQIDGSRTRKHGGTGLGLVISRKLIEMMGGTLIVESKKGQGSVFSFILKFETGKRKGHVSETAEEGYIIRTKTDASILLVEDDEVNRKVIGRMLKEIGYSYDVADCGKDALELLKQKDYDACLMDIQMPGMDGVQTAAIIRENELNKGKRHMPIAAITAYALKGDRERFLAMGMDEYIAKPFQISELYILLERLLGGKDGTFKAKSAAVKEISSYLQEYAQKVQPKLNTIKNNIEELKFVIKMEDMQKAEERAHEVKGLASSISANKIKTLAFRIELAARRGNRAEVDELCRELEEVFQKYSASINETEEPV